MTQKLIVALTIFMLCIAPLYAQQVKLLIYATDHHGLPLKDTNNLVTNKSNNAYPNIADAYTQLKKTLALWQEQGFIAASVDSAAITDSAVIAYVYKGNEYKWAKVNFDAVPKAVQMAANLRLSDWDGKTISPKKLAKLNSEMLTYFENNGYPFASTQLRNQHLTDKGLIADFVIEQGRLVRIDSIIIDGNVEIGRGFLQSYLGVKQGDVYNESQIRLISKRIKELTYIEESRPWQMNFTVIKNQLKLFLKERKSNQLNGLVGLQPNTNATGKFLLTADVLLGLKNIFGYGETINAVYQNLQYKSPRLITNFALPYLMGTPFGVEAGFELFKRDTTFYRTTLELAGKFQLSANDYFKVGYQNIGNRIITADTAFVKNQKRLPENPDIQSHGVVVEFYTDKTDFRLNPQKGWQAKVNATALLRNIKPNNFITELTDGGGFDYARLYDTINNNKYQYRFSAAANYFFPLFKNTVVKVGYSGGYLQGQNLFLNELFQIGGFKLMRGFDEQSIFASQYHIATAELRFILGSESYFYLFSDNAYIERVYQNNRYYNTPISFGGGITLQNKSGLFNIALGLGKYSGAPLQFNQTKIHFGYAAYF